MSKSRQNKLDALYDRIQQWEARPDNLAELADILYETIEEVQAIDRVLTDHLKDVE